MFVISMNGDIAISFSMDNIELRKRFTQRGVILSGEEDGDGVEI